MTHILLRRRNPVPPKRAHAQDVVEACFKVEIAEKIAINPAPCADMAVVLLHPEARLRENYSPAKCAARRSDQAGAKPNAFSNRLT
jgi:hypothetical protein